MVFHHLVGLEDVGANLVTPRGLDVFAADLLNGIQMMLLLQGEQFSLEHIEGIFTVLNLAALGLTVHNKTGGDVFEAHRGRDFIHILTSRSTGANEFPFELVFFDFEFSIVIDFRSHFHESERGFTGVFSIERGEAHQAVNAVFVLEVAVSEGALYFKRSAFDAGLFGGAEVQLRGFPTASVAIAEVHSHEHFGKILGIHAAGSRMERKDGGVRVIRTAEVELNVQTVVRFFGLGEVFFELAHGFFVVGSHHFGEVEQVLHVVFEPFPFLKRAANKTRFFGNFLCVFLIAPKIRRAHFHLKSSEF